MLRGCGSKYSVSTRTIIYHVLTVSEIIQRETINFKKVVDGQVTFFFLFKEFYSKLSQHKLNVIKTLWPTVDLNTWSPSSNVFFLQEPRAGPSPWELSWFTTLNKPLQHAQVPENRNMKRVPRRVGFSDEKIDFHMVSWGLMLTSTEIQSEICPLNVFFPPIPSIKNRYPQNDFHVPYISIACLFTSKTACPHCALTINHVIPDSHFCSRWSVPNFLLAPWGASQVWSNWGSLRCWGSLNKGTPLRSSNIDFVTWETQMHFGIDGLLLHFSTTVSSNTSLRYFPALLYNALLQISLQKQTKTLF